MTLFTKKCHSGETECYSDETECHSDETEFHSDETECHSERSRGIFFLDVSTSCRALRST